MKHRFLAVAATALIGVIAIALVRGSIGLDVAAMRAVILVAVVIVIDRLVMPWVQLALASRDDTESSGASTPR